jgi:hypothetical protein
MQCVEMASGKAHGAFRQCETGKKGEIGYAGDGNGRDAIATTLATPAMKIRGSVRLF